MAFFEAVSLSLTLVGRLVHDTSGPGRTRGESSVVTGWNMWVARMPLDSVSSIIGSDVPIESLDEQFHLCRLVGTAALAEFPAPIRVNPHRPRSVTPRPDLATIGRSAARSYAGQSACRLRGKSGGAASRMVSNIAPSASSFSKCGASMAARSSSRRARRSLSRSNSSWFQQHFEPQVILGLGMVTRNPIGQLSIDRGRILVGLCHVHLRSDPSIGCKASTL